MNELEQIKFQLSNKDPEILINALFDAWEHEEAGIELIAQSLGDKNRKVRQAALLLLRESNTEIAKETVCNYLPFSNIQCLHTIEYFEFNSFSIPSESHPDNFEIANYDNTLVSYWEIDYKNSGMAIWNLETGSLEREKDLRAHEFGLGDDGKVFVTSYQHLCFVYELKTGKQIDDYPDQFIHGINALDGEFIVCKQNKSIIAKLSHCGYSGEIEIWNYRNYSCSLNVKFDNLLLCPRDIFGILITPFLFTIDGEFFIVCFFDKQKHSLIKIWDTETQELIQTIENLPKLIVTSVGVSLNKTIIACGIREEKVCVWELQTDKIIFTADEMCPSILSNNGRVLIYATANYEIVVRDLIKEKELCRLTGHNAPIAYITLSEDYEFIASYSVDRQIKIW